MPGKRAPYSRNLGAFNLQMVNLHFKENTLSKQQKVKPVAGTTGKAYLCCITQRTVAERAHDQG
jgi:hypothetical protein